MEQRDSFSYQCGVVDAFNEMVAAEVKALALSHPMDTREEMEALIAYAHEISFPPPSTAGSTIFSSTRPIM